MQWCFGLAVCLSAFLLLGVQPMLAKLLLPMVGGAAGVWTASMIFFQLLLLAGYGYAALSSRFLSPLKQSALHLLLCAIAVLHFTPLMLHAATAQQPPEFWIVTTLLFTVGLPYLLLAANSSMLQRWYFATFAREPYHLFSASNLGSFVGLFAYPFAIEWLYPIPEQLRLWSYGFIMMVLVLALFPLALKHRSIAPERAENLPLKRIGEVVFLAFIPSSLFLSTTLHVTSDIGAFPLMWVIPLALYLFSFVVVFAPWGNPWIKVAQLLHPLALLMLGVSRLLPTHTLAIISNFLFFFIIAVSCHGALARLKPTPQQLTMYFFWVSAGGALGGIGNLVAQHVFNNLYEYHLVIVLSILALPGRRELFARIKQHKWLTLIALILLAVCLQVSGPAGQGKKILLTERNFYGVSRVLRDAKFTVFEHGTTLHGIQSVSGDTTHLTSYYGPVDTLLAHMPSHFFNRPIGAVGLGAGTVACAKRRQMPIEFFEINPQVIDIAKNPAYFTFLSNCKPDATVTVGDGRLMLAKQPEARYNLLILDAFSSDSVPIHLLTQEAFAMYKTRLARDGLMMINVSSRYLNLTPFIARVAESVGLTAYRMDNFPTAEALEKGENPSIWLALMPDDRWKKVVESIGYKAEVPDAGIPVWTDNYSNVVPAIIW